MPSLQNGFNPEIENALYAAYFRYGCEQQNSQHNQQKKDCRHSIFIEFICSLQILLRQDHFLLFAAFYDRMAAEFIPECCHYLTVECIILK